MTFVKTDGTVREMVCTLQQGKIEPYESKTGRVKAESDEVVAVWDLEKDAWRSFRVDCIEDVVVMENINV